MTERTMRLTVGALAAFHLVEGLWMLVAPGSFFDLIGRYGLENSHYVGDLGAFVLAYGFALVLAVGRPSWRAPLLAVGAAWHAVHAVNPVVDIGESRSSGRGIADTILLALGAGVLAWLASVATRLERR
jgi:hypothetical protein